MMVFLSINNKEEQEKYLKKIKNQNINKEKKEKCDKIKDKLLTFES